jgi:hypothetical protein
LTAVSGQPDPAAQPRLAATAGQPPAAARPPPSDETSGTPADRLYADAAAFPASRLILALLAVLRGATLVLGGIELSSAASWGEARTGALLLAVLTCLSAVTFTRAGRRLAGRSGREPFDAATLASETAGGIAALFLLASATPPAARAGSGFWAEPYTVVSAVIIAAAARRAWAGGLAVGCLAGTYLLAVLSPFPGPPASDQASVTATWVNATSYVAFFIVALVGVRLLRSITGQAETLRQMIAVLSAERSKFAAADRIWQIGHDVPKALLREVRRGTMPPDQVRAWAPKFRADLLALLAADPRAPVRLCDELTRLASTYSTAMRLDTDLTAMNGQPLGIPALLMAEAVRELLNNASYHRYGYPARLTSWSSAKQVEVSVHNDGPGVDPRRLASAWALKQNIIHQFEAAGGSYHISSAPATDGTTVALCYPGDSTRGTTAP